MKRVALVTGCFGFIGSHLVDLLLERGHSVLGIGRKRETKKQNCISFIDSSEFRLIGEDILKLDTERIERIDDVFHLATARARNGVMDLTKVNVMGTLSILELARNAGAKRFVFSSSASVYGNTNDVPITEATPLSPVDMYGASKASAEKYIEVYGNQGDFETCILRYANVFGPRQAPNLGAISIFINRTLKNELVTLEGDGSYQYTPIYVEDAVEATYLASQQPSAAGAIINICGSETVRLMDIINRIKEHIPDSSSDIEFKHPRPNWSDSQIVSTDTMSELLGFMPKWSFERALLTTIDWYSNSNK